ncbi:MAG: hypothetical protein PHW54_06815, partial [Candidatus Omnitrophica bacterium]|nr:hypothetical protein [Candidatus Omnitrophota bacterium]
MQKVFGVILIFMGMGVCFEAYKFWEKADKGLMMFLWGRKNEKWREIEKDSLKALGIAFILFITGLALALSGIMLRSEEH